MAAGNIFAGRERLGGSEFGRSHPQSWKWFMDGGSDWIEMVSSGAVGVPKENSHRGTLR